MLRCMPFWKGCNRQVDYVDQRHRNLDQVPDELLRYSRTLEELLLDANHIRELPKVSSTFNCACFSHNDVDWRKCSYEYRSTENHNINMSK